MPDPSSLRGDEELRRVYAAAARTVGPHPKEAALGRLLAGGMDAAERMEVLEHVAGCGECASLVQHVARCPECEREFAARAASPGPARLPRVSAWLPLAAAACLVAAAAWLVSRASRPAIGPPPSLESQAPVAVVRDGAGEIRLTADGRLEGLPSADEDLRRALATALRSGVLPLPQALAALRGASLQLRGHAPPADFRPLAPLATVVRSDRPTFRWTPLAGAQGYVVSVSGEDLTPVTESPRLTKTDWTPARPLARDTTYLWQVAAVTRHGRRAVPAPPEPEARFRVLGAGASRALERALAAVHGSRLASGFLLARAGVVDEAEPFLATLAADNPANAEVTRLVEALRGVAGPRP